ncbi:eukaryotic translation initiation factor 3 subunit A-like [Trifolium pratense]|uniref:eukaryotic translation initiation factor 3 subunit A-like n=1 Tax=Trifolium pratense TaxID=57577 RepID=UPI001E6926B0|nr:eukaryotic translation initiation factor 3 subunit A-like [Trifolium pratense]
MVEFLISALFSFPLSIKIKKIIVASACSQLLGPFLFFKNLYIFKVRLLEEHEKRFSLKGKKPPKTMDHLERAKREEAAPLIEAAYQQRLVEERILHEREQQMQVELSKQRHAGDLHEKERLSRIMGNKEIYQEKVVNHRQAETDRLKREREDRISRILQSRKQEREKMRKLKYFLQVEEERPQELLLQKQIVGATVAASQMVTGGTATPHLVMAGVGHLQLGHLPGFRVIVIDILLVLYWFF